MQQALFILEQQILRFSGICAEALLPAQFQAHQNFTCVAGLFRLAHRLCPALAGIFGFMP
jgi:hypothetical protein